jgi:hypothetical protein
MEQTHQHYNHFLAPSAAFSQSWEHEKEFKEVMHQKGICLSGDVKNDGQIHRFPTGDKTNNQDGWYVFFGLAGAFGDWRRGYSF